jgi:outer membrane autotransporter protein
MYKPFRRHWNADNVEHNLSVDGIARGARMHRVNRLLLLLSTAATLDGLVASREALAGCSPSPTPGNDTIVCDVTIPPPTIPSLDLSSGGRDSVTIQSGTILGNVTFANDRGSLTVNGGLIGGSIFFGNAQNDININGGQLVGTINTGNGNNQISWTGGSIGGLRAGTGNDNFTISSGANLSSVIVLDGGGGNDNLRFRGATGQLPTLINWEHVRFQEGTKLTIAPAGGSVTADDLTIDNGSSIVTDPSGGKGTINAPITNAGAIESNGAGSKITANQTVDNGGTISATNMGAMQIDGAITNSGTIAASGGGTIAANSDVTNTSSGTIIADGPGSSTSIAGTTNNQGTMAATGGGALAFGGGVINSGQITADGAGSSISAAGGMTNSGVISTTGGGSATINGQITNTGTINTSQGGGAISAAGAINSSGTIDISNGGGAIATGANLVNTGVINAAGGSAMIIAAGSLDNQGTINLNNGTANSTLTVIGNLTGNGQINSGVVITQTGGAADKVIVTGDVGGKNKLAVTNLGATTLPGAPTESSGADLVVARGQAPANAFTFNAPFNYLPIGPFRYELAQASDPAGGTAYRIQAAFDAVDGMKVPALAPSTVGFVAGFTGALSLSESFLSQLYQREGDSALRDEGHGNGWIRAIGRWNNLGQSTFGIGYHESIYGVQGGIGLVRGELTGGDLLRLGVTFGFATNEGSAELHSAHSDIRVSGTSVGAFATWFADATRKQGAYADLTVQHSWLSFFLDIPVSPIASYRGTSWGGKIETGYRIPFGQWMIEPQVLLTYVSVHADGIIGRDQLIAEGNTVDSLLGRARTRLIGLATLGNGWLLEPHVEFGVLSRLAGDQAVFVGGLPFATNMPTTVGEVGAGGTLAVSAMTTLFADTDVQLGRKYAGLSGRGGFKVRW